MLVLLISEYVYESFQHHARSLRFGPTRDDGRILAQRPNRWNRPSGSFHIGGLHVLAVQAGDLPVGLALDAGVGDADGPQVGEGGLDKPRLRLSALLLRGLAVPLRDSRTAEVDETSGRVWNHLAQQCLIHPPFANRRLEDRPILLTRQRVYDGEAIGVARGKLRERVAVDHVAPRLVRID